MGLTLEFDGFEEIQPIVDSEIKNKNLDFLDFIAKRAVRIDAEWFGLWLQRVKDEKCRIFFGGVFVLR